VHFVFLIAYHLLSSAVIETSSEFKAILNQVAEEDYASEELQIKKNLLHFKLLLP
jgi:hypothetical protein